MKKFINITAALVAIAGVADAETRAQYIADRCSPQILSMTRIWGFGLSDCCAHHGYYYDLRAQIAAANAWRRPYQECIRRHMPLDRDPNIVWAQQGAALEAACGG